MIIIRNHYSPFLDWLILNKRPAPNTFSGYKSRINILGKWLNDRDFTLEHCLGFLSVKYGEGKTGAYLEGFVFTMRAFGDYCVDKDLLKVNFAKHIPLPKRDKKLPEILTVEEVKKLCEAKPHYPFQKPTCQLFYKTLFYFLALTGCRVGEALSLQVEDVDLDKAHFKIRETKTGQERLVPLANKLIPLLRKLIKIRELKSKDYIFGSIFFRKKKLASGHVINMELKRRAKLVGIKKRVHCHQFRHSFITELLRAGVGQQHVADLAGHKDTKITSTIYSHLLIDDLLKAVELHPLADGKKLPTKENLIERNYQLLLKISKKLGIT